MSKNQKLDIPILTDAAQPYRSRFILPAVTVTKLKQLPQHHTGRKILAGSGAALVVLIGGLLYITYGTSLALGPVMVGGTKLKLSASNSAVQQQIADEAGRYKFSLAAPLQTARSYSLADAGISVNNAGSAAGAKATVRHLNWQRFAWWHSTKIPLVVTKDQTQFSAFVTEHIAISNQPAKDATLTVVSGKANITDGANGSTYKLPGGNQTIAQAATTLEPLNVTLVKATVKPAITTANLVVAQTKAEAFMAHNVIFSVEDKTITASPADVGSWLDIDPAPAHKTVDVSVNSGKVQAYLDKATAGSIFPARSQITTTDAAGVVTVLSAGQSGSDITNKADAVKSVTAQLQQPTKDIHADLAVAHKQFTTISAADYPKWIVVDLTSKRMYAYEHSTLVRSFLISAGAPKTPTVTGTYQIYSKYTVKDMRGSNADGSRYFQPHVHYVNFFYKDYAIHGNYWRPTSYFGNINSSHGCVGITDSDAAWVYDWAPIGTTVITHS